MIIGINTAEGEGVDPVAKARGYQEKHKLTYPILIDADGKVREAYGVFAFPTTVFIDPEGKVE